MQTPGGNVNIGIDGMTHFLVVNIPGFRSVWDKFIMEPTPRVHKVLERADIAGDTTTDDGTAAFRFDGFEMALCKPDSR